MAYQPPPPSPYQREKLSRTRFWSIIGGIVALVVAVGVGAAMIGNDDDGEADVVQSAPTSTVYTPELLQWRAQLACESILKSAPRYATDFSGERTLPPPDLDGVWITLGAWRSDTAQGNFHCQTSWNQTTEMMTVESIKDVA